MTSNNNNNNKPKCYGCGKEIIFDPTIKSQKSGKMIPLDPTTKSFHSHTDQEVADYARKKAETEFNEVNSATQQQAPATAATLTEAPLTFLTEEQNKKLDAIASSIHSVSRLRIFSNNSPKEIERLHNDFVDKIRLFGCTPKGTPSIAGSGAEGANAYTIFIYFECPLEFKEEVEKLYEYA